jgi:arylsulfatase A-like enzyme
VLFIAVDDLNDWIGCLGGHPQAKTPRLGPRLAAMGTLFTNAHCAAPLCNPSRAALMTGVRPSTSGVCDNNHMAGLRPRWPRPSPCRRCSRPTAIGPPARQVPRLLPDAASRAEYYRRRPSRSPSTRCPRVSP